MHELLAILEDIISSEYAQWMRYTYLSALGFGLNTDPLQFQFEEHAADELEHAKRVTRWLVDLGGLPPTEVPCVEQYSGSTEGAIEWLLEYELVGIEKYSYAHELAGCLGLYGLQSEIGTVLEKEHEHTSELLKFVNPHIVSGDEATIIVVANSLRRFAHFGGDLYQKLIVDRFNGIRKRLAVEYQEYTWDEIEQGGNEVTQYVRGMIDSAMENALKDAPEDTGELIKVLPEWSRQWMVGDIESQVRELWPQRNSQEARSGILFFQQVYEWLTSQETIGSWDSIFESLMPNWQGMFSQEWEQELAVEPEYQQPMDEIFQTIQEMGQEQPAEEPIEEPAEEPGPEQQAQPEPEEQARRPIETELEKTLTILDPESQKKDFVVSIGDEIFNGTAKQILKSYIGSEDYPITRDQANQYATGILREIRDDGKILVEVPGAEEPFDEQLWNVKDRLWGSREEGQRLVKSRPADFKGEHYI